METSLLKRFVVGAPMPLSLARHERLSKTVALAVFASDALSSTAYATEEILRVLVLAGSAALGVACIAVIAFGNLRGVRESGRIFAVPTYLFIFTFGALVLTGLIRYALGEVRPLTETVVHPATTLSGFLVLRAFASGCTAMTGMEAISNGVPAFKEPEAHNAAVTSRWMAGILAALFLGLTGLAAAYRVVPVEHETVVSMLGRALFGRGAFYYLIQAATALILIL